jgi:nitroreductase
MNGHIIKGHSTPESHVEPEEPRREPPETHIETPETHYPPRASMGVLEAIYTRRSIRKFLDTPIEYDKLMEVVRAGSYAPCAGNLQNWKFIVETDRERIRSMYHHTLEQAAFTTAPAAIIVVAETEVAEQYYGMRGKRLYAVQNCAAAIQNILLAAHSLGLGAVWIGAFDENRINDLYKVPSSARTQAIVLLGYPDERPQPRHMKHLWYLVNFQRYGLKYARPHLITHDLSTEWEQKRAQLEGAAGRITRKLGLKGGDDQGGKGKRLVGKAAGQVQTRARQLLASLKKKPAKRR